MPGDWVSANPEYANLEDGVIENCADIPDDYLEGAFSKIVASAWVDWKTGIAVKAWRLRGGIQWKNVQGSGATG